MTWRDATFCLAALLASTAPLRAGPERVPSAPPARFTRALAATPDLTQTDPRARFPGAGAHYCAPVAVANAFMRLAREGYPRLVPRARDPVVAHIDVARRLASPAYMATHASRGTSTDGVLKGIEGYVRDRGYAIARLAYRGWRRHAVRFGTRHGRPDLDWIRRERARPAAAGWINAGWYVHDAERDVYRRVGGHWMTLAGYGVDARGRLAPDVLVLRDPSPRAGAHPRFEFVRVTTLDEGRLEGPQDGLPRAAAGVLRLGAGMHLQAGADVALVDGAVLLQLRAPAANGRR